MRSDRAAIIELIRNRDDFLITSHINPDGDSIASQLALQRIFHLLGRKGTIVNSNEVPRIYRFLPGADSILVRQRHSTRPYSALFVLDCGHPSRASGFLSGRKAPTVVNIDHHVTNDRYGDLNWVEPRSSSTCEIIYEIARKAGVAIDTVLASLLYTGILTDTGSFRYSSTTARSMSIASRLLRHGIDPHTIAESVYENAEYESLRLLGRVLSRIGKSSDGRVSWVTFSHRDLGSLSNPAETEEFVNYARSLDSSRIAVGFKEIKPGEVRISFRSKGAVDVSELASRYGGGGHRNAAGCTVRGRLGTVVKKITGEAGLYLEEGGMAGT